MKILIIGMFESIHLTKWVQLMDAERHDIIIFPSHKYYLSDELKKCEARIVYPDFILRWTSRILGDQIGCRMAAFRERISLLRNKNRIAAKEKTLVRIIKTEKPDLIHSMETQKAGYLVLGVKESFFLNKKFPLWFHTNWGSDIYLFGRLKEHKEKIRKIMSECNFYSCESQRDIDLARLFGYTGPVFQPFPNACGFDINELQKKYNGNKPSARKQILVKGYQGWSGRALTALKAIELAADCLIDYKIVIFSAEHREDVHIAAELIGEEKKLDFLILKKSVSHDTMLKLFLESRLYIGISISDGISTSMLEAMAMGAFPIQTSTSTASEWIVDGYTGFVVSPDNPDKIAACIRAAITDDMLVDNASLRNFGVIKERADSSKIKKQIVKIYSEIEKSITPE